MSRHATCDRCERSAPIRRDDSLPIGWMYFTRDKVQPGFIDDAPGYDLCDGCFVNIQQEITFAKMARS